VYEVPVYRDAPPEEAAYQSMDPALAVAEISTVPVPHLFPPDEELTEGPADVVKDTWAP
jgi:hypothetical protein